MSIGVVLALGFLLLLVAFQAPLIAAIGVLTNLLSTAAAFGVAKLIFQDGNLAGLLGFESQGFLDAWAPVFAIAMDYTVFLLSSAREHWEATGSAREAMVGGLALLLDAFLVRLLLLPVLLRLTGSAAWYMPRWLGQVLPDVRFGHGEEVATAGEVR